MAIHKFSKILSDVLSISRPVGVFPLSKDMRVSKTLMLLSLAIILGLFALFLTVSSQSISRSSTSEDRYSLIMLFRLTFYFLIPLINLIKLSLGPEDFNSILEILWLNEMTLRRLGTNAKVVYEKKIIYLVSVGRYIFIILNELLSFKYRSYDQFENACRSAYLLLGIGVYQVLQLQYYVIVHLLDTQMALLIRYLEKTPRPREYGIWSVLVVQNRVTTGCWIMDRLYAHQSLAAVSYEYISFVTNTYQVCMSVRSYLYGESLDVEGLLLMASWSLYSFISLCLLADKCTQVIIKAQKINKLLYRILMVNKQKELIQFAKLKLHFIVARKISFTACGLFPMDYSMVHAILASTLTYLVVMIQMTS